MNGPLKATLGLAAFVVVLGAVLWIATDRAYFAVFIPLGLLTGAGAWFTGRTNRSAAPGATHRSSEENNP